MPTDIDAIIVSALTESIRSLKEKLASDKQHARTRPSTTLREWTRRDWSDGEVLLTSKVLDTIVSAYGHDSANEVIMARVQALLDSSGERLRGKLVVDEKTQRFMVIA